MPVLALDVGDKRIGIAVTDPLGLTVLPFKTLTRADNLQADIEQILAIVKERKTKEIVVGYPKTLREKISLQTQKVIVFIAALKEKTELPVIEWDERFSTMAAHRQMAEIGLSRKQKKAKVDQLAACFILEGYLQRKRLNK